MERTDRTVVVDAGPLIHLDEVECLDLLDTYANILIPAVVWVEVLKHRPNLIAHNVSQYVDAGARPLSSRLITLKVTMGLDAGEVAALALAQSVSAQLLFTDDAAARHAGEALGLRVHGTIGLVIRSVRTKQRTPGQVIEILESMPKRSTLHIARPILDEAIAAVRLRL